LQIVYPSRSGAKKTSPHLYLLAKRYVCAVVTRLLGLNRVVVRIDTFLQGSPGPQGLIGPQGEEGKRVSNLKWTFLIQQKTTLHSGLLYQIKLVWERGVIIIRKTPWCRFLIIELCSRNANHRTVDRSKDHGPL